MMSFIQAPGGGQQVSKEEYFLKQPDTDRSRHLTQEQQPSAERWPPVPAHPFISATSQYQNPGYAQPYSSPAATVPHPLQLDPFGFNFSERASTSQAEAPVQNSACVPALENILLSTPVSTAVNYDRWSDNPGNMMFPPVIDHGEVERIKEQQRIQQQRQGQGIYPAEQQYWPRQGVQRPRISQRPSESIPNIFRLPFQYRASQQTEHMGIDGASHVDGVDDQLLLKSGTHVIGPPATVPQDQLPATPAPASTPAASRRDSQSSTPRSRRRSSAQKNRPKVSRSAAKPHHESALTRSLLERFYPPISYNFRFNSSTRKRPLKGATTASATNAPLYFAQSASQSAQDETSPSRCHCGSMASGGGKWREEQILIICPGSRTTLAQLGCSELTPPAHRIPTRMFRDGNEWRPYYTYKRTKVVGGEEQEEWVEDVDEDKGALYPIEGGRIINMDAFLAFLDHVHGLLTTTYHNTPIMLMASPQWTRPDCEAIAQYIFERTRTPALCMIHSGIATQYGLKWPNMTVIDIGYEKVDVTAIHDGRVVNHMDLGSPGPDRKISGGEVFTRKLMQLLKNKEFTRDMAEQLKKSAICEVLPYAAGEEALMELPRETSVPTAAVVDHASPELTRAEPSRPLGDGADGENGETNGEDDGVLDVASIVTSGQTKEFLAKKEKEKATKGGRKPKDKDNDTAAAKPVRLPNSKRTHNTFAFEEIVMEEVIPEPVKAPEIKVPEVTAPETTNGTSSEAPADAPKIDTNGDTPAVTDGAASADAVADKPAGNTDAPKPEEEDKPMENAPAPAEEVKPAESAPTPTAPLPFAADVNTTPEHRPKRVKRDIEVGIERFTFAERAEIDRIVTTIFRTIQGIDDMYMRPACWENLVFVGNGARLRGLKENILQTLSARHLISPSTATMFTSELPSNVATPTGTGSQTPTGSYTGAPHQLSSSGVNPLLQAATTASAAGVAATPQAPGSEAAGPTQHHHFHSQTPTNIRTVTYPNYLAEWTKNGFEEAMFLGAQVAARISFCLHSNMDAQSLEAQRQSNLSRVDYNELGPKGIRTHSMLS